MNQPAFEIHLGQRTIRIWADGRVEGLDGMSAIIVNRIPILIAQAVTAAVTRRAA